MDGHGSEAWSQKSRLVLAVREMMNPEDNKVMLEVLQQSLDPAPNADCIVYAGICRCT